MPTLTGIQVIRHVREVMRVTSHQLPFVLLHSSADDQEINAARQSLAIQKVMSKPVTLHQLTAVLSSVEAPHQFPDAVAEPGDYVSDQAVSILLADDNPMNRLLARTMIAKVLPNAQISEASDGQEAVERFAELRPAVVLLDIQMPNLSGYEACQRIRAIESSRTIVIALTAGTVKGERERCLEMGMNDYISKPFVLDTLAAVFHRWISAKPSGAGQETTSSEAPASQHINWTTCLKTVGNDSETAKEMIAAMFDELDEDLPRLHQAAQAQDMPELKRLGHKHKASAAMVGMEVLTTLMRELENQKEFGAQVEGLVQSITEEVSVVRSLSAFSPPPFVQ
jgi:CheY-like chemotaxis protein/HPt (histidine-containing phosphotransfer) domain-containing protein